MVEWVEGSAKRGELIRRLEWNQVMLFPSSFLPSKLRAKSRGRDGMTIKGCPFGCVVSIDACRWPADGTDAIRLAWLLIERRWRAAAGSRGKSNYLMNLTAADNVQPIVGRRFNTLASDEDGGAGRLAF